MTTKLKHIYRFGGEGRFRRQLEKEYPDYGPDRIDRIEGSIIGGQRLSRLGCEGTCRSGRRSHHHPSTGRTHSHAHAKGHHGG